MTTVPNTNADYAKFLNENPPRDDTFSSPDLSLGRVWTFTDSEGDPYRALWTSENDGWVVAFRAESLYAPDAEWEQVDEDFLLDFAPYTRHDGTTFDNGEEELARLYKEHIAPKSPVIDCYKCGGGKQVCDLCKYRVAARVRETQEPITYSDKPVTLDMSTFEGGGRRSSDEGKPKFEYLLAPDMPYDEQILARVANRMEAGARHYGENNYGKMHTEDALNRARSSLLRHTIQYLNGETDEDHLAAIGCNILMVSKIEHNIKRKAEGSNE